MSTSTTIGKCTATVFHANGWATLTIDGRPNHGMTLDDLADAKRAIEWAQGEMATRTNDRAQIAALGRAANG